MITIPNKLKKEVYKMDYTPEDRWIRRGHTRKPNGIVRGIYWLIDWFGDFSYLFRTIKRFIGYSTLITINFLILVCIIVSSAAHSLQLLRYAGAPVGIDFALLFAWEAMFITGSFLLDKAIKLKKYFAFSPWMMFLFGWIFVEASNIIGMAHNLAGILIGGATPIILLFNKGALLWLIKHGNASEFRGRNNAGINPEMLQVSSQKSAPNSEEKPAKSSLNFVQKLLQKFKKPAAKTSENYTEIGSETTSENEKNNAENSSENEVEKISDESETNPATARDTSSKNLQKNDSEEAQKTKKSSQKSVAKKRKRTRRNTRRNREKEIQKAIEIIRKSLEENGEFPTHEAVAALAKTTKYYAQEARKLVKAELEQQQQGENQQQEGQRLAS